MAASTRFREYTKIALMQNINEVECSGTVVLLHCNNKHTVLSGLEGLQLQNGV